MTAIFPEDLLTLSCSRKPEVNHHGRKPEVNHYAGNLVYGKITTGYSWLAIKIWIDPDKQFKYCLTDYLDCDN